MSDGQAHAEAVEAATGGRVHPATGRCRGCQRLADDPHAPACWYARTLGLPTAPVVPARTIERQFLVRWQAHLHVAQYDAFLADFALLLTHVQQRERRRLTTDEGLYRRAVDETAAEIARESR